MARRKKSKMLLWIATKFCSNLRKHLSSCLSWYANIGENYLCWVTARYSPQGIHSKIWISEGNSLHALNILKLDLGCLLAFINIHRFFFWLYNRRLQIIRKFYQLDVCKVIIGESQRTEQWFKASRTHQADLPVFKIIESLARWQIETIKASKIVRSKRREEEV